LLESELRDEVDHTAENQENRTSTRWFVSALREIKNNMAH